MHLIDIRYHYQIRVFGITHPLPDSIMYCFLQVLINNFMSLYALCLSYVAIKTILSNKIVYPIKLILITYLVS